MKRRIISVFVATLCVQVAHAIPCGNLMKDVSVATYTFTHAPPSQRKALAQASIQRATVPDALRVMLGSDATVTNSFSVVNMQFATDSTPKQTAMLAQFSYVSTVSFSNAPDKCFFVWFSPNNQLLDLNVIINIDPSGSTVSLGSNNRLDSDLYMTLTGM